MTAEEESGNEEMSSAQESLAEAEKSGGLRSRAAFQNLLQVSSIVPLFLQLFPCICFPET